MGDLSEVCDDLVKIIFSWVGYGASLGESSCPVARIPCVSKKWKKLYYEMVCEGLFVRYPLKRLMDWTLQMEKSTAIDWFGEGDIESVVDPASRNLLPRWQDNPRNRNQILWWTSNDGSFTGQRWESFPAEVDLEPFHCTNSINPPTLEVCFSKPTIVRAIAIEGRNVPVLVRVGPDDDYESDFLISFRPSIQPLEVVIQSDEYMELVYEHLPQGKRASPDVLRRVPQLPAAFTSPVLCHGKLRLHLLQSREARWVGMNVLGVFGEIVKPEPGTP